MPLPLKSALSVAALALTTLAGCQMGAGRTAETGIVGETPVVETAVDPGNSVVGEMMEVVRPRRAEPPAREALAMSCPGNVAQAADLSEAINAVRGAEGKVILKPNETLALVAQSHACDTARMGRATVAGSNGSSIVDRARAAGYPTCGVIQMVNVGGTAQGVLNGWMASPPHREQILGQQSDDIGVGVTTGPDGRAWWSVVIGENCR